MDKIVELAWYNYNPIYKIRFISLLKEYLKCDVKTAQGFLALLLDGQTIRLNLDLDLEQCDEFLYRMVDLEFNLLYYSWHEEE